MTGVFVVGFVGGFSHFMSAWAHCSQVLQENMLSQEQPTPLPSCDGVPLLFIAGGIFKIGYCVLNSNIVKLSLCYLRHHPCGHSATAVGFGNARALCFNSCSLLALSADWKGFLLFFLLFCLMAACISRVEVFLFLEAVGSHRHS